MEANDNLTVTMTVQQWNALLVILQKSGPYDVVHLVVQSILSSFNEQNSQPRNGADTQEALRPN